MDIKHMVNSQSELTIEIYERAVTFGKSGINVTLPKTEALELAKAILDAYEMLPYWGIKELR